MLPQYPIHEEGVGEKVRATLQPGLTNRLTKYLRTTQQLIEEGRDAVSSKELGDFTGINPVQVRRDLNAIGFSGTRGVGYQAYDVFDDNPEKIGRTVGNVVVKHIDELKKSVTEAEEIIGIIATPASSAQEVANLMVDSDIRVILNYTDVLLHVPSNVDVHRIDPTAQLMHTLYYLTQAEGQEAS